MAASLTSQNNDTKPTPRPAAGGRVLLALGRWLAGSVMFVGITLAAAMSVAPGWASNSNESATVIAAEVYAALIVALCAAFRGFAGLSNSLRIRAVPAHADVTSFAVVLGLTYI